MPAKKPVAQQPFYSFEELCQKFDSWDEGFIMYLIGLGAFGFKIAEVNHASIGYPRVTVDIVATTLADDDSFYTELYEDYEVTLKGMAAEGYCNESIARAMFESTYYLSGDVRKKFEAMLSAKPLTKQGVGHF